MSSKIAKDHPEHPILIRDSESARTTLQNSTPSGVSEFEANVGPLVPTFRGNARKLPPKRGPFDRPSPAKPNNLAGKTTRLQMLAGGLDISALVASALASDRHLRW